MKYFTVVLTVLLSLSFIQCKTLAGGAGSRNDEWYDQQIIMLRQQLSASNDPFDTTRLQKMIRFREQPETRKEYHRLAGLYGSEYITRACSVQKRINLAYETVSEEKVRGSFLEKTFSSTKCATGIAVFLHPTLRRIRNILEGDAIKGIASGSFTDWGYQSSKLFLDSSDAFMDSVEKKIMRESALMIDLRNRYRRVVNLALSPESIQYFTALQKDKGLGTVQRPLYIASIGGGPGSIEMDIQQVLKDRYGLNSMIVIFDVVEENRRLGSYFARMRGADICWVINRAGVDDLLTDYNGSKLDNRLSNQIKAIDSEGLKCVLPPAQNLFHCMVMSGFWEYFPDECVVPWMKISAKMMSSGACSVVTLMWNKFRDRGGKEKIIPGTKFMDYLGRDKNGVWYRSTQTVRDTRLLEKGGFALRDAAEGPIFHVLSIVSLKK